MQWLKKILEFYVYANIHVAFAGYCLTDITLIINGVEGSWVPEFVALSILVSYNFIRYLEVKSGAVNWLINWFRNHFLLLLVLNIVSVGVMGWILLLERVEPSSLFVIAPIAMLTFFYVIPFYKSKEKAFNVRNIPGFKLLVIAFSWAVVTYVFPLYEANSGMHYFYSAGFLKQLVFLIVLLFPFDIRDMFVDDSSLKTIPQLLGEKWTKLAGSILLLLSWLLPDGSFKNYHEPMITLVIMLVLMGMLLFSNPKRSRFYTAFWVEGIPILWWVLLILFG